MEPIIDIILIVLPIVIVGAIALFVISRLKAKQRRGTLGKKETTEAQTLLDSLIPLGAGIGMLAGYFAYEFYSKAEKSHS